MADTRARWTARVAGWRTSGLTSEAYCEGKPFTAGGLRHWAYRLRHRQQQEPPADKAVRVRVARVVRAPARPDLSAGSRPLPSVSHESVAVGETFVIEVGPARIAVRPGFDRATLAAVLEVLATPAKGAR